WLRTTRLGVRVPPGALDVMLGTTLHGWFFVSEELNMDFVGIKIGHATDEVHHTGCTVFLCPPQTVGSVDVRGPAPGSREAALLHPEKPVTWVNAVMLSGGSAFGLATADGAM